ncbi:hypothetical protein HanRHA438_Chr02g0079951 [Helianthus annuus]|uniref:Uncharacterized protein n=1 Tax=Helianthus annuus TaxID=4232 RepID=A0A9K3P0B5_HELAN|nr:hypothetical protein HanXRQr2_Chr02g0068851 [Helianthus annuus]KAJ0604926.1 hypothetical protein HanHA300_Chr02g0057251 [Helianthus annuus]KAJ0618941.1 hypothetical protein HanHA89_Chr02g0065751 [Helianthus annuus]KAJ0940132.1 hypothetical protein HanRHA438_Chr02g0079951 [Helianthus annuus]
MLLELLRHHMLTDVLVLRIAYDDSYLMLSLMMFYLVLYVLTLDHIVACVQKLLDFMSLMLL